MFKRLFSILLTVLVASPAQVLALTLPNDPEFANQWYHQRIGSTAAWDFTQGGDVVVAVLDTGVDWKHPDLAANIWTNTKEVPGNGFDDDQNGYIDDIRGWNFVENTNDPSPQLQSGWTEAGLTHGTVIAGIIGAVGNNLSAIAGITWKVKIMPLRILDSQGIGNSSEAARAIDYAVRNGARVLNFSFVTDEHNIGLDEAITRAAKAGMLVVAAAGNNKATSGDNLDLTPMYPVCSDGPGTNYVLGVTASDLNDKKADFANYGLNCVDISAPGENILSTQVYNPTLSSFASLTRGGWNGTSVASPMVAGAAALLLAANPGLSRETLMQALISTAEPIDAINQVYRGQLGSGRLNVDRAVRVALGLPVILPTPQSLPPSAEKLSFVVLGANPGVAPEVRVYSPDGIQFSKFTAYASTFRGGVNVAAGDVDGDGSAEIITGGGPGRRPHVRVFDLKGNVKSQFFAYATAFRGGVSVAVGDLDGDGSAEIITGAGPGGGPHVRIFAMDGTVKNQFFAHERTVTTGVNVAAGDIDGDGLAEIAVAPASKAGSVPVMYFSNTLEFRGKITFLASTALGGVTITIADVVGDSKGDIVLARTQTSASITVITSGATPRTPFTVSGFTGMYVSTIDIDNDGRADILAVPATGSAKVRLFDGSGKALSGASFTAAFTNGARIAGVSTAKPK